MSAVFRPSSKADYSREARHLLRALLRECTYLPDSIAQFHIKKQQLHRFRNLRTKARNLLLHIDLPEDARLPLSVCKELDKPLRDAHKTLSGLRRANDGEPRPLEKILRYTYGRSGPRRYDLLAPLLQPDDVPSNSATLEAALKEAQRNLSPPTWDVTSVPVPSLFQPPSEVQGHAIKYTISPRFSRFKALAESQARIRPPELFRTQLKSAAYEMPAKNIWGRSMPRCRVSNLVQRAYANLLDRTFPPLPEHEWTRLHGLVYGTVKWEGCKPRRKRIGGKPTALSCQDLEKLVHIGDEQGERLYLDSQLKHCTYNIPVSKEEKILQIYESNLGQGYWKPADTWLADAALVNAANEDILIDELRIVKPLNKTTLSGKYRSNKITARFMRRLYAKIFKACPMLSWHSERSKWQVVWGSEPQPFSAAARDAYFAPLFQVKQVEQIPQTKPRVPDQCPLDSSSELLIQDGSNQIVTQDSTPTQSLNNGRQIESRG